MNLSEKIQALIHKGVIIPNPYCIDIGDDINIDRISGDNVTIYAGCKLYGASTFIQQCVTLGYEAPVTLCDCQLGRGVELNGGFFNDAVFLKNVKVGSGAHVREGTILEEESSAAHTVGLKQTILFPYVTLGSLINFCDCLMAGGTDRKNHSEVGSSYIHFNYTPDQHKATASLMGDVSRGVMLNQKPIFLGGQGGLVGPCTLEYGTIIAAGTICRKDELRPDRLLFGGARKQGNIAYKYGLFQAETRLIKKNIQYIANLMALKQWYIHVRSQFVGDDFALEVLEGLQSKVGMTIQERMKRFKEYYVQNANPEILSKWAEFKDRQQENGEFSGENKERELFLKNISSQIQAMGKDYIRVIKSLDQEQIHSGTLWLKNLIDFIINNTSTILLDA